MGEDQEDGKRIAQKTLIEESAQPVTWEEAKEAEERWDRDWEAPADTGDAYWHDLADDRPARGEDLKVDSALMGDSDEVSNYRQDSRRHFGEGSMLNRTSLGTDIKTDELVEIDDRLRGVYLIGKNKTGKTSLMLNMLIEDIEAGMGVCLCDPHGDFTNDVRCRIPKHRQSDVILCDPSDPSYRFGLNLFSSHNLTDEESRSRRLTQLVQAFRKVSADYDWGITVDTMLHQLGYVFLRTPGMTMEHIDQFLIEKPFRDRLLAGIQNRTVLRYWQDFDTMAPRDRSDFMRPLLSRISTFMLNDALTRIVTVPETTIDFGGIIDGQKILLLRLPAGMDEEVVKLVGTVFVGQLLVAALDRYRLAPAERTPFALYCDEFQRFATPDFATIFNEARKYGIALTIAHQTRVQFDDPKIAAGAKSAGNIVVFEVMGEDADELAKEFDHTPLPAEITGYRAGRVISVRPLNVIYEKGHPDPEVEEIFRKRLEPMMEAIGQEKRYTLNYGERKYQYTSPECEFAIGPLNHYFTAAMRGKAFAHGLVHEDLFEGMYYLGNYFGFPDFIKHCTREELALFLHPEKDDRRFQGDLSEEDWLAGRWLFLTEGGIVGLVEGRHIAAQRSAGMGVKTWVGSESLYAHVFFWQMIKLAQLLHKNPVYETAPDQEPIYGSVRTYNDMEAQIRNELVTMPLFHARCKLSNREHTIKTFPSPVRGDDFRPLPTWNPPVPRPIEISPLRQDVGEQSLPAQSTPLIQPSGTARRATNLVRRVPSRD